MPISEVAVVALDDLTEGRHPNGAHRLAVEGPAGDVAGTLGAAGWRVLAVTVDAESDKGSLLAGLATAGGFPGWVGANWDALLDALRDLSWAPAEGYAVLIDGWDAFAAAQPADSAVLLAVLADAATWWDDAGTPFHVLLRG
jgi:hypothetical protein